MESDVHPSDVEKIYGALSHRKITDSGPANREELMKYGFQNWDDYFDDCLEQLLNTYEHAVESDGKYYLEELEQDKHLERCEKYRDL